MAILQVFTKLHVPNVSFRGGTSYCVWKNQNTTFYLTLVEALFFTRFDFAIATIFIVVNLLVFFKQSIQKCVVINEEDQYQVSSKFYRMVEHCK